MLLAALLLLYSILMSKVMLLYYLYRIFLSVKLLSDLYLLESLE